MLDPYTESVFTNIGINIVMTLSMYLPLAVGQLSIAQVAFMAIGAHVATVLTLWSGYVYFAEYFGNVARAGRRP